MQGIKTHLQAMQYIARLGFETVPHFVKTDKGYFLEQFGAKGVTYTNKDGSEEFFTWEQYDKATNHSGAV